MQAVEQSERLVEELSAYRTRQLLAQVEARLAMRSHQPAPTQEEAQINHFTKDVASGFWHSGVARTEVLLLYSGFCFYISIRAEAKYINLDDV